MTIIDLDERLIKTFLEKNGFTKVDEFTLVRNKYREYISVQRYQEQVYVSLIDAGTGACEIFQVDLSRTVLHGELTKENEFKGSLELYGDKNCHISIVS